LQSPVNTFRVILNTYFGADCPVLKAESINLGINPP
jgi:hypothetical protein